MKRGRLIGVMAALLFLLLIPSAATHSAPNETQGLQISPVIIDFTADKGQTYTFNLSLTNVTTGDLVFRTFVNDFRAKDETGNPQILLTQTLPTTASITTWVSKPVPMTIKAKQTILLPISFKVPANAEPGGHYGIIRFSGTAPYLNENGVSLAASAGPLILVKVNGAITEKLSLADFFLEQKNKPAGLFEAGPLNVVSRITNEGNVHLKPQGDVVVTNLFGKTIATLKVNPRAGNVLPQSTRRFSQILKQRHLFGKYTASVQVAYGTHGHVLKGEQTFWVIPYKLLAFGLISLILLILVLRQLIKGYNKRIISRAQGKNKHGHHSRSRR